MIAALQQLFARDLERLHKEIEAYQSEATLWVVEKQVSNSAGNLCLHLVGNLNAFIGAALGNTGYVRQRELEFSQKNVPRAELIESVKATAAMVQSVLDVFPEEKLSEVYPIAVFGEPMTTEFFLLHLTTHLNYHLGQINYHRRLLEQP